MTLFDWHFSRNDYQHGTTLSFQVQEQREKKKKDYENLIKLPSPQDTSLDFSCQV